MRRFFCATFFLTLLLASCQPQPVVAVPTSIPSPVSLPFTHAPEIRFALIGKPPASDSHVNVWGLFDEAGASYINYALRAEYWPRLYHLAPQDSSFQPYAADGQPSEVKQDGDKYSATVKLRVSLKWTDGSPFTAEDIAFTANTALAFELGYDWGTFYLRDYLDHAEAVDVSTVKFVFKKKPNVGVWQYGLLQAPIVQKTFWESTVNGATKLLPADTLRTSIDKTRANLATVNAEFADVSAQAIDLKVRGLQSRQLSMDYTRLQDEVFHVQNTLDKYLESYAAQINSAQKALYAGSDENEPTLGVWMPDVKKNDVWANKANPDFPFGKPNFDRSTYTFFADEKAALSAFQKDEVDFVLSPNGISSDVQDELTLKYNPTYYARFLVFNPLRPQLADPAFRSALNCMIDRKILVADVENNKVAALDSFVLSSQWHDANLKDACDGMDKSSRINYAVKSLKDAGYSWTQEPRSESQGQNLLMSNGEAFPKIVLLATTKEEDALRYAAAKYIAEQAQYLGIPFAVQEVGLNDIVYAVYSSQKYDMALMGWRLSEYPAYLCGWFGGKNLFLYNGNRFTPTCEALGAEINLNAARPAAAQMEAVLMSELPFIPLFTEKQAEVYRNLSYPTQSILNGWSGLYGAPSYAIPAP